MSLRNDVWALSLGAIPQWSELIPSATLPSERRFHTAIYEPVSDGMLVFGGWDGSNLNDVWALSLGPSPEWTELKPSGTPPSARCFHTAIYDPVRDRMIVFGGVDWPPLLNDVWALSLGATPQWTDLTPTETPPIARPPRTWHVKAHGKGDAPTIQAAIDSAGNGDTVILGNGTYTGDGNRDIDYHGKAITVRSQSDNPRVCIIDCQGSKLDPHRGFYFSGEDSNSVLRGVTITNGYAPTGDVLACAAEPGRVRDRLAKLFSRVPTANEASVRGSSDSLRPTMEALKVPWAEYRKQVTDSNFEVLRGRGLGFRVREERLPPLSTDLMLSLEGPTISDQLYRYGGAIFYDGSCGGTVSPRFVNCSFVHNSADYGGGVYAHTGSLTFVNCSFIDNGANYGGGVCAAGNWSGGLMTFTNCSFSGNSGNGLAAGWCGTKLEGCTLENNSPDGLTCVPDCSLTLSRCTFKNNSDDGLSGGGCTSVNATDCTFSGNGRGGLFAMLCVIKLVDCEISGNNGVGLRLHESEAKLESCTFCANREGGVLGGLWSGVEAVDCVFLKNGASSEREWVGGGVGNWWGGTVLTGCTFLENSGSRGGGLGVDSGGGGTTTVIENCTFVGNSATSGGAIFVQGAGEGEESAQVSNCTFWRNSAARGGALYYAGPDTTYGWPEPLVVTLADCTLFGNTGKQGGGIFCEGVVSLDLKSTIIAGSSNGEAVFCNEVTTNSALTCCDIFGNSGGDWVGCIEDQFEVNGNFSLDPLFCKPEKEEFGLAALSPCLPANNACGVLIGAHGEGCKTPKGTPASDPPKTGQVVLSSSPNPFNPATRMTYTLSTQGFVRLSMYDVAGRLVEELVDAVQPAGEHVVEWNAGNLPSGIYFCRLEAAGVVETRKLLLLK